MHTQTTGITILGEKEQNNYVIAKKKKTKIQLYIIELEKLQNTKLDRKMCDWHFDNYGTLWAKIIRKTVIICEAIFI